MMIEFFSGFLCKFFVISLFYLQINTQSIHSILFIIINSMIVYNLVFLLAINFIIVPIPLPFPIYLPLAFIQPLIFGTGSVYQMISLNRIHTDIQQKNAFKMAKKKFHPDKGGSAQDFALFQNMKSFVNINGTNYYDKYGILELKGEKKIALQDQKNHKQLIIIVESGMYYIMTLILILSVTLEDEKRYLRKYILLAMIGVGGSQLFAFYNPTYLTLIDLIIPTMPLHQQYFYLNNFLSCLIGMIRNIHNRKISDQKKLFNGIYENMKKSNTQQSNIQILKKINEIYEIKVKKREIQQNSLLNKAKKFIGKGLSIFFIILMVKSFIE